MPWFSDLELHRYGVEYIDNDLYVSMLHRDGGMLHWWDDFEQTYRSFATINKEDADKLRYSRAKFIPISRDSWRKRKRRHVYFMSVASRHKAAWRLPWYLRPCEPQPLFIVFA